LERARKEQEEIDRKLSEESPQIISGNGRVQGLFQDDVLKTSAQDMDDNGSPNGTIDDSNVRSLEKPKANSPAQGYEEWKLAIESNGIPTPPPTSSSSEVDHLESRPIKQLQRTKTVRFSPTIEAREFDLSSPVYAPIKGPGTSLFDDAKPVEPLAQENQEHLQLSLEEAFFLSYGLGVLKIHCDDGDAVPPPSSLLSLFRRHSYYPPRSPSEPLDPDDPFMTSYVAYHHYRSLGWVVRSGVKFSTDYLLYNRGPAFSHAEFAVILIPSYTHAYWTEGPGKTQSTTNKSKSWWWLHGINRVQAQVQKQLVLCYVDIPPPLTEEEKRQDLDIAKLLSRYKVRDVSVRRWTPNRSRD
jgi:tRNA-splicing endonuclease subunit Sen2